MTRLAAIALVALAAASSSGAAQAPPTIVPGTLTVALSLPSPGFQAGAVRPNGSVVAARGLEIDLARSLAARLGIRRVRFRNEPSFPRLLARGQKPWDVALAEVTITSARRGSVDFSSSYLRADTGVLMAKDLPAPKSLAELAGLRLCYQAGTTTAGLVANRIRPRLAPYRFTSVDVLFERLRTKRCQAVLLDAPVLAAERAEAPYRYGPLAGVIVTGEQWGVVLPKGSQLTRRVTTAINRLVANGTVARLQRRWLSTDVTKLPILD